MKVTITKYTEDYLDLSWSWLNDPEIRKNTNTPIFTKEDQLKWYHSLEKENYKIWGITCDGKPIGVCGLKNITEIDCEYWGYIGEKDYWGKGIGGFIMKMLEKKAKNLKLESIWLQVLRTNQRAIRLYIKTGYQIEKKDSSLIYMRKKI